MTGTISAKPHFAYIDCVRGYAVLLVIASHLAFAFPELPNPVRRLVITGWFGVQLFFLASCLTLLMSWHSELRRQGKVSLRGFVLRRFFRIAPAYYAAGVLYFFIQPPEFGIDPCQALRTALFINAWHPAWLTAGDTWTVVPGGWSISVEFAFYAVFPLFAATMTSLRLAWVGLVGCLAIGLTANLMVAPSLLHAFTPEEVENFLFFWFPNQISVFALGAVLFFTLRDCPRLMAWFERHSMALGIAAIAGFCALAYMPAGGKYLGDGPWPPAGQLACIPMAVLVLALSRHGGALVNHAAKTMGEVSFSAYLLHFAVLHLFALPELAFLTEATGVEAIMAYGVGFALCVAVTFGLAWLSYRWIEQPMIALGKRVIGNRSLTRPATAQAP